MPRKPKGPLIPARVRRALRDIVSLSPEDQEKLARVLAEIAGAWGESLRSYPLPEPMKRALCDFAGVLQRRFHETPHTLAWEMEQSLVRLLVAELEKKSRARRGDERFEQMQRMKAAQWTDEQIAVAWECSVQNVRAFRYRRKHGYRKRR